MTRDEAVTLIGYRLGSRTDLDAKIILEMDFVQTFQLEGTGAFIPWFLESEISNVNTAAGEERVALPTDFLGEIEDQSLWLYDPDNGDGPFTELVKASYDRVILRYQGATIPREYAVVGDYLLLRPVPDAVYNIRMRYYARDVSVKTGNIQNKWLKEAADLLIAETGVTMASKHLQNPTLAAEFRTDAGIARQRLYTKHESRKHTNRTYGMGED